MIENECQYAVTLDWAQRFERHADELQSGAALAPGVDPAFRVILVDASRSEARRLREELAEYERRLGGRDPGDEDAT